MSSRKHRAKSAIVKGRKSGKSLLSHRKLLQNAAEEYEGIRNANASLNEENFSNVNENRNRNGNGNVNGNIHVDNLETLTKRYANTNLNNDLRFVANENYQKNHNENVKRQEREIANEIDSVASQDYYYNPDAKTDLSPFNNEYKKNIREFHNAENYNYNNNNNTMEAKKLSKIYNLYNKTHNGNMSSSIDLKKKFSDRKKQYKKISNALTKRIANKHAIINAKRKEYTQESYNKATKYILDQYKVNLHPYPEELLKKLKPSLQYNFSFISQTLPLHDIETIVGPFSVNLLRLDYDNGIYQNFFIFGEQHELDKGLGQRYFKPESTVAFDGFIKAILTNYPDSNFDLYLEQDYFPQNVEENVKSLNKYAKSENINTLLKIMQYTFLNCMPLFDKSKCKYNNLRIHIADFRKYYLNIKLLMLFYHKYELLNNAPEDLLISVNNKLTEILKLEKMEGSKMIKQKQTINEDFINIIDEYFDDIFNNTELTTTNIISKITALMDKYTILRMLRAFDESKETMGRTKHWNQTNIFGYFGNRHSENICNILRQLGAKPLLTEKNTTKKYNSYIYMFDKKQFPSSILLSKYIERMLSVTHHPPIAL